MQEIIYLLIAFLSISHGQFSSEDHSSYRRELYNAKDGTYGRNVLWNRILRKPQYHRESHSQFKCIKSGIYAVAYDCRKYYECIKVDSKFQHTKYRQLIRECESGKVFSYVYGTCTQPRKSGRKECMKYQRHERPEFEEHQPQNGTDRNTWEELDPQIISFNITPKSVKSKEKCQREGFIPHPTNKKKYYRCLRHRSGEFVLYEFSCNSGTIWDRLKQMCSNPRNVIETNNSKSEESNRSNKMCIKIHN